MKTPKEANQLKVAVTVGKNGITDATVDELRRHMKKDKIVKVRLLKSATHETSTKEQAEALAAKAGCALVEVRGFTAVYVRA